MSQSLEVRAANKKSGAGGKAEFTIGGEKGEDSLVNTSPINLDLEKKLHSILHINVATIWPKSVRPVPTNGGNLSYILYIKHF